MTDAPLKKPWWVASPYPGINLTVAILFGLALALQAPSLVEDIQAGEINAWRAVAFVFATVVIVGYAASGVWAYRARRALNFASTRPGDSNEHLT
jgi:hypothetical protein